MEYHELGIWLLLTLGTLTEGIESLNKIQRDVAHSGYVYEKPSVPLELPEEPHEHHHDHHDHEHHHPNPEEIITEKDESHTPEVPSIEEDHSETHEDGRVTIPNHETENDHAHHRHPDHNDVSRPYLPPSHHHYLPPKHHPADHFNLLETKNNPIQFLYKYDPDGEFKKLKRNPASEGSKNISDILRKIKKDKKFV